MSLPGGCIRSFIVDMLPRMLSGDVDNHQTEQVDVAISTYFYSYR